MKFRLRVDIQAATFRVVAACKNFGFSWLLMIRTGDRDEGEFGQEGLLVRLKDGFRLVNGHDGWDLPERLIVRTDA